MWTNVSIYKRRKHEDREMKTKLIENVSVSYWLTKTTGPTGAPYILHSDGCMGNMIMKVNSLFIPRLTLNISVLASMHVQSFYLAEVMSHSYVQPWISRIVFFLNIHLNVNSNLCMVNKQKCTTSRGHTYMHRGGESALVEKRKWKGSEAWRLASDIA